jgi:hypothetical protein
MAILVPIRLDVSCRVHLRDLGCAQKLLWEVLFVRAVFRITPVSQEKQIVRSSKNQFSHTNSEIVFSNLHGRSYGGIVLPDFLDKFTKNYRHGLKMGYIDAARHQLHYELKVRV